MGGKPHDLAGKRFGRLLAIKLTGESTEQGVYWDCVCDCGESVKTLSKALVNGTKKSCGCLKKEQTKIANQQRAEDLTGRRFGRLVVIKKTENKVGDYYKWECKCDCGNTFEANPNTLRSGATRSCGCLSIENKIELAKKMGADTAKDLTNQRFGRLVAIEKTDMREGNVVVWKCKCDCGKIHYSNTNKLCMGNTLSCGCLKEELDKTMHDRYLNHVEGTTIEMIASKTIPIDNTSGARGVSWNKRNQMWRAYITFKKQQYHLGYFHKIEDAKEARRIAENRIYGEFLEWYYETYPDKKKT